RLSMFKNTFFSIIIGIVLIMVSCGNFSKQEEDMGKTNVENEVDKLNTEDLQKQNNLVSANQTEAYLPYLKGKRVGIVANQTTVIFKESRTKSQEQRLFTHLVDSLIALKVNVKKVYAPEHG